MRQQVALFVAALLVIYVFVLPAVSFDAECRYSGGEVVLVHQNICPSGWGGSDLVDSDVEFSLAITGETTWQVYLKPKHNGHPHLYDLIRQVYVRLSE